MLSDAISTAKIFLGIHEYFQKHSELLNEIGVFRTPVECGYRVAYSHDKHTRSLSEFDIHYQFISFFPGQDVIYGNAKDLDTYYTLEDTKDCSTEEVYFQKSTLYSPDVCDALAIIDYLEKSGCTSFYIDTESIPYLINEFNLGHLYEL